MVCPRDCQDFNEKLIDSCKDYKVQHVDDDFSKTSVKLGKLREKFEERYEFLREACILCKIEEAIPNLKWRDGGLLQIFLELTPEETHEEFKTVLTRMSTYTTVDHFLSADFAVVQDTSEKFDSAERKSKKLPSIGQVQTKSSGKFQGSSQYNPRREYRGSHPRLQMLVEEPDSDDDDIDEGDEGDQEREGEEDFELLIAARQGVNPQFVKHQVKNQIKPKAADTSRRGRSVCIRYEREGKCPKGSSVTTRMRTTTFSSSGVTLQHDYTTKAKLEESQED